eukprot:CAMPEP_0195142608 /NCGR_PEP_ID=MMETSP0448-20130528/164903_1 /TAXON_ID=66468 /ORGANISM="Heterocapsa triquestra, Strain CCMP 448" /LENGTH=557 /DNA_ID=CAMNT_0040181009 /DNA_START=268 /DNA_END=1941 /DNA_ORIENTATION=-
MVCKCNHLKPYEVHGTVRATIQEPTQGGCNPVDRGCYAEFRSMTQLPYCTQYASKRRLSATEDGAHEDVEEQIRKMIAEQKKEKELDKELDEKLDRDRRENHPKLDEKLEKEKDLQKEGTILHGDAHEGPGSRRDGDAERPAAGMRRERCAYWDAIKMARTSEASMGKLFVPTRVQKIHQVSNCTPGDDNHWSCFPKLFVADGAQEEPFFIADVESFTVLINNAFHTMDRAGLAGEASDFDAVLDPNRGMFDVGKLRHEIHEEGLRKFVADLVIPKAKDATSPFPDAVSTSVGDVLSIGDLLRLADPRGTDLMDAARVGHSTIRWDGAVVEVDVTYTNKMSFDFFGLTKPHYVISAYYPKIGKYKATYGVERDDGRRRDLFGVHGIFFKFHVHGQIGRFDLNYLCTIVATFIVNVGLAATVTDYVMMWGMSYKAKYTILKYQPTADFGKFRDSMGRLQRQHGDRYDPMDHKPLAHADILNDLTERKRPLEDDELLLILLKFEQRLNRLDGLDEFNAHCLDEDERTSDKKDKGAAYLHNYEKNYKFSGILSHREAYAE